MKPEHKYLVGEWIGLLVLVYGVHEWFGVGPSLVLLGLFISIQFVESSE